MRRQAKARRRKEIGKYIEFVIVTIIGLIFAWDMLGAAELERGGVRILGGEIFALPDVYMAYYLLKQVGKDLLEVFWREDGRYIDDYEE